MIVASAPWLRDTADMFQGSSRTRRTAYPHPIVRTVPELSARYSVFEGNTALSELGCVECSTWASLHPEALGGLRSYLPASCSLGPGWPYDEALSA